jgi:valyl-tRNA synthetase
VLVSGSIREALGWIVSLPTCTHSAVDQTTSRAVEKARLSDKTTKPKASSNGKRTRQMSTAAILAQTDHYMERVNELEAQLDITLRWSRTCPEYIEMKAYYNERAYHKAANTLRAQVIQRLMELAKCHMPNTSEHVSL